MRKLKQLTLGQQTKAPVFEEVTMDNISVLVTIIGVLVALTNIVVEVIKKVTWNKLPTNIVATVVAEVLTIVAFFAYASYSNMQVVWYSVVSAVIVGILVAYAAMFGFDKLKEILHFSK